MSLVHSTSAKVSAPFWLIWYFSLDWHVIAWNGFETQKKQGQNNYTEPYFTILNGATMERQQTQVSILEFFLPPPKLMFGSLFSKTTIPLETASQRYSQSIIMWPNLLKERYKEAMFISFFWSFALQEILSILRVQNTANPNT